MSVFDCHVNRSPVAGRIERIAYHARQLPQRRSRQGQRETTSATCSSSRRPAALSHRRDPDRRPGGAAHRAVCARRRDRCRRPAHRHDPLRLSRRRLIFRRACAALVGEGQTAIAGETVIADLRAAEPARVFQRRLNAVVFNIDLAGGDRRIAAERHGGPPQTLYWRHGNRVSPPSSDRRLRAAAASAASRCACWCRTSSRCWRSARA